MFDRYASIDNNMAHSTRAVPVLHTVEVFSGAVVFIESYSNFSMNKIASSIRCTAA